MKQNEYDKLRKRVKNLTKEKMHILKAKYKRLKAVYYGELSLGWMINSDELPEFTLHIQGKVYECHRRFRLHIRVR